MTNSALIKLPKFYLGDLYTNTERDLFFDFFFKSGAQNIFFFEFDEKMTKKVTDILDEIEKDLPEQIYFIRDSVYFVYVFRPEH